MRICRGNSPMGWITEGSCTYAVSEVGGKTRILFLSMPGMRARWILSGRLMVR